MANTVELIPNTSSQQQANESIFHPWNMSSQPEVTTTNTITNQTNSVEEEYNEDNEEEEEEEDFKADFNCDSCDSFEEDDGNMNSRDVETESEDETSKIHYSPVYTNLVFQDEQELMGNPSPSVAHDDPAYDLIWNPDDIIFNKYRIVKLLGKGAYGQVVEAIDEEEVGISGVVAIKIIKNKSMFAKQAKTEIRILEKIKENDPDDVIDCVKMKTSFEFMNHLCIVFELLSIDIYTLLTQIEFQGLPLALIKNYSKQILKCLDYLDSLHIIHCDLKPENILLKSLDDWSNIKIIDFGSSCFDNERAFTYIQSRFYRAPEVAFGDAYTGVIDMWSFGCIVFELLTGRPLFPGENEFILVYYICTMFEIPSAQYLSQCSNTYKYFDLIDHKFDLKIPPNTRPLFSLEETIRRFLQSTMDPTDLNLLIDFLRCILVVDPKSRISPKDALLHPFLKD